MPNLDAMRGSINYPSINANNFEIKLKMFQIIQRNLQFRGSMNEDPDEHLKRFPTLYDTFNIILYLMTLFAFGYFLSLCVMMLLCGWIHGWWSQQTRGTSLPTGFLPSTFPRVKR
ncbi:hypothetical protein EPI10_005758 [Gossypium australe]|uniref:Uncharacterized protein n=1 Tax=Gossypium australe TaxID=47621 RepID=A0A5B6WNZ6_9ROSI|nr:hypothetical protein EPI10_005758 [Gossypium australe]